MHKYYKLSRRIHRMKKLFNYAPFIVALGLLFALAMIPEGRCDVVSLDANYVAGQTDVIGKLNRDRIALTNGINNVRGVYAGTVQTSGQVKAATIGNENMADDASPRVYLDELFIEGMDSNHGLIASGLNFVTSSSLTASAQPGVAYTRGYRVEKASSTPHTFTANKWTYAFICQDGSFDYLERNINVNLTDSEYPDTCQPLSRVSSDATTVNAVKDLRKTKFTFESYDSVYDEGTESSLKNLLQANGNSFKSGAMLQYSDVSSFVVTAGSAMINGQARDRSSYTSDPAWPVATNPEDDGLEAGTRGTATYYVYLVADADDQRAYTVVHSLSATNPAGKTNYLKIGEFYNNGGTISKDSVISYVNGLNITPNANAFVKGWVNANTTGAAATINDSYNVSSITEGGAGAKTIAWDNDFSNTKYVVSCLAGNSEAVACYTTSLAAGSAVVVVTDSVNEIMVSAVGNQ